MWLPDWLYRALPNLYGLAGLVTVYKFNTLLGICSGVLLITTAGLIFIMRRDYQQGNTCNQHQRQKKV
jgi:hypothetical protein